MEQDSFFTAVLSSFILELILFSLAYLCGLSSTEKICGKPKVSDHFRIKAEKK